MSFALFLNPNLTTEQAMALHKQQAEQAIALMKQFEKSVSEIQDQKQREIYCRYMFPIIMQQCACL